MFFSYLVVNNTDVEMEVSHEEEKPKDLVSTKPFDEKGKLILGKVRFLFGRVGWGTFYNFILRVWPCGAVQ